MSPSSPMKQNTSDTLLWRILENKRLTQVTEWMNMRATEKWPALYQGIKRGLNEPMPFTAKGFLWLERRSAQAGHWFNTTLAHRWVGKGMVSVKDFFRRRLADMDYKYFDPFHLPPLRHAMLANPPDVILLYMLFPVVMGIRAYDAYRHAPIKTMVKPDKPDDGKVTQTKDLSGLWKILRRDGISFGLFALGLKPFRVALQRVMEKTSQIPLTKSVYQEGMELSFKELADAYTIRTPQNILAQLLFIRQRGFSWDGVRHAIETMMPEAETHPNLKAYKQTFRSQMDALMLSLDERIPPALEDVKEGAARRILDKHQPSLTLAEAAFETLTAYEQQFQAFQEAVQKELKASPVQNFLHQINPFKGHPVGVKTFMTEYAHWRVLPTHVMAFLFVAGMIGFLPVALNRLFDKAAKPHAAPAKPSPSPQAHFNVLPQQNVLSAFPAPSKTVPIPLRNPICTPNHTPAFWQSAGLTLHP